MTPQERASQLYHIIKYEAESSAAIEQIADAIEEAETEVLRYSSMVAVDMEKALAQEYARGYADAKEQVAGK